MYNFFLVLILIFPAISASASRIDQQSKSIQYKTYFGDCPSKTTGALTLNLIKEFEKRSSLKDVKDKILSEKLDEKYFLSAYKITYNPVIKRLNMNFECPRPLAKVQIYKSNGVEHFSAILADNSKLYEPHFENLMRLENKLTHHLPLLALSLEQIEGHAPTALAGLINLIEPSLRKQISEMILSQSNDLTIIMAFEGKPMSIFMGADQWEEKIGKLFKVIGYVSKNKRYPSSINLVNAKKVVVKFSDKI
jgi:hypothetical protein